MSNDRNLRCVHGYAWRSCPLAGEAANHGSGPSRCAKWAPAGPAVEKAKKAWDSQAAFQARINVQRRLDF